MQNERIVINPEEAGVPERDYSLRADNGVWTCAVYERVAETDLSKITGRQSNMLIQETIGREFPRLDHSVWQLKECSPRVTRVAVR